MNYAIDGAELTYPIQNAERRGGILRSPRGAIRVEPKSHWTLCVALGQPRLVLASVANQPPRRTALFAGCFGLLAPGEPYSARTEGDAETSFAVFNIDNWVGARSLNEQIQGFHNDEYLARSVIALGLNTVGERARRWTLSDDVTAALGGEVERAFQRVHNSPFELRRKLNHFASSQLPDAVRVEAMADFIDCNTAQLYRQCKSLVGSSPYRLARQVRFRKAAQLLEYTEWPLAQIALEAGYCDQSHMTKTFMRLAGETPSAYRRNRR